MIALFLITSITYFIDDKISIDINKMLERIIVLPQSTSLSKTLAYHNKSIFNTRFFTPVELAKESLMRSGKVCDKAIISSSEELAYYFEPISKTEYFKTNKLSDLKSVNSTINTIRKLVIEDEDNKLKEILSKGIFKEKNEGLFNVYSLYIQKLNEENKIDKIGLIRYALDNSEIINSEFIVLKEFKLQPLELELIKKISNNTYKEISLYELFGIDKKNIHIESYKNCYGLSNEIASIITDIYKNNNQDLSVIACADYPSYSQIIFDYACTYNIPVSFGRGISIINSYPGKLLEQYYHWMSTGNYGWKPFFDLIFSPYFNFELLSSYIEYEDEKRFNVEEFWKRVSRLRLTNNLEENNQIINDFKNAISRSDFNNNDKLEKYIPGIEIVAKELSLPIEDFLTKYYKTRNNNEMLYRLDESSKNVICNEIKSIKRIGLEISDDVIENILRKPAYRQSNLPGHIFVTTIDDASLSLRDSLYVCGLSANTYPGSPSENPLLLDSDLNDFNNDVLTSKGKIKDKRENIFNLLNLASALNNKIYLSYPGLNVSELKNNNASSLLFEIYKQEYGEDKKLNDLNEHIEKIGYFEPELSISRKIGEAYNKSEEIIYNPKQSDNDELVPISLSKYSPSALNTFFNCKKQFFYKNILRIPEMDDYNPYEVIPVTDQGTLAHSLMEYLADHKGISKEEFLAFSNTVFDEYMKICVPLIKDNIENTREEFLDMMSNGYDFDQKYKRRLAFKEEDKVCEHVESKVTIHGFPDRVELTDDGKAVIIDFKTERKRGLHIKDDIDTCLQVIIYAYLVEHTMNIEVDHCEYRLLRFEDGIVTCKYDDEIKNQLTEKLLEFKHSLDTGDYSIEPFSKEEEKDKCKYCKYGSICGKVVTEKQDE